MDDLTKRTGILWTPFLFSRSLNFCMQAFDSCLLISGLDLSLGPAVCGFKARGNCNLGAGSLALGIWATLILIFKLIFVYQLLIFSYLSPGVTPSHVWSE